MVQIIYFDILLDLLISIICLMVSITAFYILHFGRLRESERTLPSLWFWGALFALSRSVFHFGNFLYDSSIIKVSETSIKFDIANKVTLLLVASIFLTLLVRNKDTLVTIGRVMGAVTKEENGREEGEGEGEG